MNDISPVNYDVIAPKYNARYAQNPLEGILRELLSLVAQSQARDVLEVGCGTGHWVNELQRTKRRLLSTFYAERRGIRRRIGSHPQQRRQSKRRAARIRHRSIVDSAGWVEPVNQLQLKAVTVA